MNVFRVYATDELDQDGYPLAWHEEIKHRVRAEADHRCVRCQHPYVVGESGIYEEGDELHPRRTQRDTGFPQATFDITFEHNAESLPLVMPSDLDRGRRTNWSPCDERCTHWGPFRVGPSWGNRRDIVKRPGQPAGVFARTYTAVEAAWRILTVHHLTGEKSDCRWWNLAALCQRCHLEIQGRVKMEQVYPWEHDEWFKPYAAGYYAAVYEGRDITRAEALERLDELLAYERTA